MSPRAGSGTIGEPTLRNVDVDEGLADFPERECRAATASPTTC